MNIPVYGKIELKNGLVLSWLEFVSQDIPNPQLEAIRVVSAQWKGAVVQCWCEK